VALVVAACRPRQWVKNALVALAPAAAGVLAQPAVIADVTGAFVSFCLLSSATYLVNDVRDRDQDRRHPRKRHRPVAAGELSAHAALRQSVVLALAGVAIAFVVAPSLGLVALSYLALTTTYSLWWRQIVLIDIAAVAGGFVIRAAAGGAAAGVPLSGSFLLVTSGCALFLVAGKRYAERTAARPGARPILRRYSARTLAAIAAAGAVVACLAYGRWALSRVTGGPWLALSLAALVAWLGRYALVLKSGSGEAPEETILRDPWLALLGAAWSLLFAGGIY
jgi:decaprenyl-phosphate phosphoribosyltransferase